MGRGNRTSRCPHCGFVQAATEPACQGCVRREIGGNRRLARVRHWAVGGKPDTLAPALLTAALGFLSWHRVLRSPTAADQISPSSLHHLVDMANLVFHEAGHWILAPFGRLLSVFGGTLFELGIPLVCLAEFIRRGDRTGAAFGLWWTGHALTGVAIYAADARAGRLVLLGGRTGRESPGTHDWHNLLEWSGLLPADRAIGWLLHGLGAAAMLTALAWLAARVARSRTVGTRDLVAPSA